MTQRAAGPKQIQIALGKALMRVLIGGVKRIHQAIAERIGVDIERRMNEMRDVGPVIPVGVVERQGRPKALALHVEPDVADALGGQLAAATFVMNALLEGDERDLAHDRVQHVLDLAGEHDAAALRVGLAREEGAEGQHLAKDRRGFGQGQRRVGHQGPLPRRQHLMHAMAQLVRQGHHIAQAALVIQQQIGMRARYGRMRKRARRLARPHRRVDPASLKEVLAN